jgi:hypothetical protein
MHLTTRHIVYPEGDVQEIEHSLRVNQLVDLNGYPLKPPLPTTRMIVFRVYKMRTSSSRGEDIIDYHLELVTRPELEELSGL